MSKNRIELCDDYAKVHFYKTDGYFLCDLDDVHLAEETSWYLSQDGYAIGWVKNKCKMFHRIVNNTPENLVTDHINRNRLDNRKTNLRNATSVMNSNNNYKQDHLPAKGVRVRYNTKGIRYVVDVHNNEFKCIRIGTFDTLSEAIEARNKAYIDIKGVPFPFIDK